METRAFQKKLKNKNVMIFDLDGTLTKSKVPIDQEMSSLLSQLLLKKKVVVISGEKFSQFKKQIISRILCGNECFKNLILLPTNSAECFVYKKGKWVRVYSLKITKKEEEEIMKEFRAALKRAGFVKPKKIYGKIIENRGTEVVFSALGQKAPLSKKDEWNKKHDIRKKIATILERVLPDFDAKVAGLTSIDVIREGVDKSYGIRKVRRYLRAHKNNMMFVGDMIFPGGNDYPATKTGIDWVRVKSPRETKRFIKFLIS
jgi:HAD superfamily hydrolase (TIGR01484 family)